MPYKTKADILARRPLTEADRAAIDRHKQDMLADLALHELRESLGITQTTLAERLTVSRPRVHAIENAGEDLRLSTLERYVDALGGELRLVAVLNGNEVPLAVHTSTRREQDMTDRDDIHTVHRDGRWFNEVEGATRASNSADTKAQAVEKGREMAIKRGVEHVIHKVDGTIGERNTYPRSRDPRSSKG